MILSLGYFEKLLGQASSPQIQKFARAWGLRDTPRKDQAVQALAAALKDRDRIVRHVDDLSPLAQAALAFLALRGQAMRSDVLALALAAAGYVLTPAWRDRYGASVSEELNQQGVAITVVSREQEYYGNIGYSFVLSDERLVQAAPALQGIPLRISAVQAPAVVHARRPSGVVLDLLALLQAVRAQNGLGLTRTNSVRVADMRKLARAMAWEEGDMRFDGLLFSQPSAALVEALEAARLLSDSSGKLLPADQPEFSMRSYVQQVRSVLFAFTDLAGWREGHLDYWHEIVHYFNVMRAALLGLLACVPAGAGFYRLDDLSDELYERVGRLAGLRGLTIYSPAYGFRNQADRRDAERELDQANRQRWQNDERIWLSYAASSWLYFLGIVEVGLEQNQVIALRLTDFGYQVLHAGAEQPARVEGPAWTIQPDFEVLVYLEHADAGQLAFVERVAERVQVAAHVARYKLSRDSVYQALECGSTLQDILEDLAAGCGVPLPQNVAASIREWAAQRDRISLRREVSLLEFPTPQIRDEALAGGIDGRPIGDRFVELSQSAAKSLSATRTVDYTRPMMRCLDVDDAGRVTLVRPAFDLLLRPMLNRWAEPAGDEVWQFTAERVAAAAGRASAAGLLAFLEQRLVGEINPWLRMVLRSWAGERVASRVGRVTVLQFEDRDLAYAIEGNPLFYGLVVGTLGPRALLVDRDRLAELRELLEWARFEVTIADE